MAFQNHCRLSVFVASCDIFLECYGQWRRHYSASRRPEVESDAHDIAEVERSAEFLRNIRHSSCSSNLNFLHLTWFFEE
jgi:hypothetical protein